MKRDMMWRFVWIGLVCVAWPGAAWSADYHVSPTGDDYNPGTAAARAFRTIQRAADAVKPGDTVHLAAGVYNGRVVMKASGTVEAPIVFRGPDKGEAVVTMTPPDPKPWDQRFAFALNERSYVVLDRITFRDCGFWLMMFDTHHCTIQDCVFDGIRGYNGIQLKNATFNRFLRCRFVKALKEWTWGPMNEWCRSYPVPGADYIEMFFNSSNNLVEDCEFGSIQHVAIVVMAFEPGNTPTRNIIRRCRFESPRWKAIGLGAAAYTLIEGNVFTGVAANFIQIESPRSIIRRNLFLKYRTSPEAEVNHDYLKGALMISSTRDRNCEGFSQHNRIFHNLFYDNEKVTTSYSFRAPIADNLFVNNVFLACGMSIFFPAPDPGRLNANGFRNNVLFGAPRGQSPISLAGKAMTLAEAAAAYPALYEGNLVADPAFVDPRTADFSLRKGSPCIDAGRALTRTVSAGNGADLLIEDALYFCDGNGLIEPDSIRIGDAEPVRIEAVNYETNAIRLREPREWAAHAPVSLDYAGKAPDIGPFEFAEGVGVDHRAVEARARVELQPRGGIHRAQPEGTEGKSLAIALGVAVKDLHAE